MTVAPPVDKWYSLEDCGAHLRLCKDGEYMLYITSEEKFSAPFKLMSYAKGEDNDYTEYMA